MGRKNHNPRRKAPFFSGHYDLDYVNLPEYPNFTRIIAKPLKTIYINLDADFNADDFYVARDCDDWILRLIAERM